MLATTFAKTATSRAVGGFAVASTKAAAIGTIMYRRIRRRRAPDPRTSVGVIINMIVDLAGVSFDTPDESTVLAASGVNLLNRQSGSPDDIDWIRRTFHGRWHEEAAVGWNWFVRGPLGIAGFAAYGQHSIKFWWLDNWWDRADTGIFGPMGVDHRLRGMRLGVVLARRALGSLQAMGYAHAIIPAAGPVAFYEKHCGARVIERLTRRS
jgi:hypothetical protein